MKRIAFDVQNDELRSALADYAQARGMDLATLARAALFEYVKRRPLKNSQIMRRLSEIE